MLRLLSRKLVAVALAGLVLGVGGGLAVARAVGVTAPSDKAAALDRLASVATTDSSTERAPSPAFEPHPIPGRILGSDVPVPVPPSVLRTRNGWLASDGKSLVAVYAGAAGGDSSLGRVVIVRQDLVAGKQAIQTLDAAATGGLTIASAPLGRPAETALQTAALRLRTAGARLLTLDLGTGRFRSN